jgi:hypothetical protein
VGKEVLCTRESRAGRERRSRFHLRSPRPGRIQRWVTPRQPIDDVHTADRTVHIQNEVAGDVAAAGAEVTIVGPVNGYVMSAGRSVTLDCDGRGSSGAQPRHRRRNRAYRCGHRRHRERTRRSCQRPARGCHSRRSCGPRRSATGDLAPGTGDGVTRRRGVRLVSAGGVTGVASPGLRGDSASPRFSQLEGRGWQDRVAPVACLVEWRPPLGCSRVLRRSRRSAT